jgi:signal peptidase I
VLYEQSAPAALAGPELMDARRRSRTGRRLAVRLLRALSVSVIIVLALAAGTVLVGRVTGRWQVIPVLTDSMAPVAPSGSVVVVTPVPVASIRPGDIMMFHAPTTGRPLVVHRVIKVTPYHGEYLFETKGDANNSRDPWIIRMKGNTTWLERLDVPYLGQLAMLMRRQAFFFVLMSFAGALLVVMALRRIWRRDDAPFPRAAADGSVPFPVATVPAPLQPVAVAPARNIIWTAPPGPDAERHPAVGAPAGDGGSSEDAPPEAPVAAPASTPSDRAESLLAAVARVGDERLGHRGPRPPLAGPGASAGGGLHSRSARSARRSRRRAGRASVRSRRVRARHRVGLLAEGVGGIGIVGMVVVLAAPSAFGSFSYTAPPVSASYSTGVLGSPSPLTCRWTSATGLTFNWTDASPAFTTGYSIDRAAVSGGPYLPVGSAAPASVTSYTDSPPAPTTVGYYVVDALHGVWSSPDSNQMASNACVAAIVAFAGSTPGFGGDGGPATSAQLTRPAAVAASGAGLYIADTGNDRVRLVDSAGNISTVAGGGTNASCAFSGPATSVRLNAPSGVAVDSAGNVFIADTGNNCVREVSGSTVTTVAGGGANRSCAYSGAAGGVRLAQPFGLAVDSGGALYIADRGNNCVRQLSGSTVTTVAGGGANRSCAYSGAAGGVRLAQPSGLAVDSAGALYIADRANNCVRQLSGSTVTSLAGGGASGACGFNGPGTSAALRAPTGVGVDSSGRVFIADTGNNCVRMVAAGTVSPVAGTGAAGLSGDNGPAVGARLRGPEGVVVSAAGNVFIADTANSLVRMVVGPL